MTYLEFHLLFILPPLLILAFTQGRRIREVHPHAPGFLGAIALIALAYTTPWDNYLVWRGVWEYGPERVIGTIGYVPIEEYLFFLLQPLLTGLWLFGRLPSVQRATSRVARWTGVAVYGFLALVGLALLTRTSGTYMGLILAWAMPVLALQWAYAGGEIWVRRSAWLVGAAVPTIYLWLADALAIREGIWRISETFTLGIGVGSFPLEEAVFFLTTNLLVVQGLLLFLYPPGRSLAKEGAASTDVMEARET
jgi:lycopene beta-cyclase